jgi:hypothetical protein
MIPELRSGYATRSFSVSFIGPRPPFYPLEATIHASDPGGVPTKQALLLLLMSSHVGYGSVKLLTPHFSVVSNSISIGARSAHALNCPGGFFDLLVIQSCQRQLRCVKRDSIPAVDC